MASRLRIIGIIIIVLGVIIGFIIYGFPVIVGSIISGIFFIALGKIIELLEKIEQKLPDRSTSQVDHVMLKYSVTSSDFDVYDSNKETYQFFSVDGDDYIQIEVFKNYIEDKENSVSFKLPSRVQQVFTKHDSYSLSVDVFSKDNIVFVKLATLGINASHLSSSIVLSYSDK
jgi:hypothetical protein